MKYVETHLPLNTEIYISYNSDREFMVVEIDGNLVMEITDQPETITILEPFENRPLTGDIFRTTGNTYRTEKRTYATDTNTGDWIEIDHQYSITTQRLRNIEEHDSETR